MGPMTTIYAIGDIHGEKALLDDIHRQIIKDATGRADDKLAVYLGDYIDRGPDSHGLHIIRDFDEIDRGLRSQPLGNFSIGLSAGWFWH
jgi:hypothetical protein